MKRGGRGGAQGGMRRGRKRRNGRGAGEEVHVPRGGEGGSATGCESEKDGEQQLLQNQGPRGKRRQAGVRRGPWREGDKLKGNGGRRRPWMRGRLEGRGEVDPCCLDGRREVEAGGRRKAPCCAPSDASPVVVPCAGARLDGPAERRRGAELHRCLLQAVPERHPPVRPQG